MRSRPCALRSVVRSVIRSVDIAGMRKVLVAVFNSTFDSTLAMRAVKAYLTSAQSSCAYDMVAQSGALSSRSSLSMRSLHGQ